MTDDNVVHIKFGRIAAGIIEELARRHSCSHEEAIGMCIILFKPLDDDVNAGHELVTEDRHVRRVWTIPKDWS
jgi:hypothetical protein